MINLYYRYFHDVEIAIESIYPTNSNLFLTALGIILGWLRDSNAGH